MGTCILNGHPSILADAVISNYARTNEEADGSHVGTRPGGFCRKWKTDSKNLDGRQHDGRVEHESSGGR